MSKLLAVIDYQNDFVIGSLGFDGAKDIDEGIAHLVQTYLARGDYVLFTYDTHNETYLETREGRALPIAHCNSQETGWQLYGKTQAVCRETCANSQIHHIIKSAFGMPPFKLARMAETLPDDIDEITVVGLVTNLCVISNAVLLRAQFPEVEMIIDASLCRAPDSIMHEKALDVMEGLQMTVINRSV